MNKIKVTMISGANIFYIITDIWQAQQYLVGQSCTTPGGRFGYVTRVELFEEGAE